MGPFYAGSSWQRFTLKGNQWDMFQEPEAGRAWDVLAAACVKPLALVVTA